VKSRQVSGNVILDQSKMISGINCR